MISLPGYKKITLIFISFLFMPALKSQNSYQKINSESDITDLPSDRLATKETIALYNNLKKLLNKGFMFGHQDDLAYGVDWKYDASTGSAGRSDIKDVTGDYPAVYGFELGRLEIDQSVNLDSVPFNNMKNFIRT